MRAPAADDFIPTDFMAGRSSRSSSDPGPLEVCLDVCGSWEVLKPEQEAAVLAVRTVTSPSGTESKETSLPVPVLDLSDGFWFGTRRYRNF